MQTQAPGWAGKYKFWVNTRWGPRPVNTNREPGPGPGKYTHPFNAAIQEIADLLNEKREMKEENVGVSIVCKENKENVGVFIVCKENKENVGVFIVCKENKE